MSGKTLWLNATFTRTEGTLDLGWPRTRDGWRYRRWLGLKGCRMRWRLNRCASASRWISGMPVRSTSSRIWKNAWRHSSRSTRTILSSSWAISGKQTCLWAWTSNSRPIRILNTCNFLTSGWKRGPPHNFSKLRTSCWTSLNSSSRSSLRMSLTTLKLKATLLAMTSWRKSSFQKHPSSQFWKRSRTSKSSLDTSSWATSRLRISIGCQFFDQAFGQR